MIYNIAEPVHQKTNSEIDKVVSILQIGGVCLVPTDTVFGLCCLPNFDDAIKKVFNLKSRDRTFNLPIMVSSIKQIEDLGVDITTNSLKLLQSKFVPGPLSIIFGFTEDKHRPSFLNGRQEVAIRIPNHEFLLSVISRVGPILMTSANLHKSQEVHYTVDPILNELNGTPDYVVEGHRQTFSPSTIVNTRYSDIIIEREGEVSEQEIYNLIS
jgi:L-threonylcarbamoyladenylate synthase